MLMYEIGRQRLLNSHLMILIFPILGVPDFVVFFVALQFYRILILDSHHRQSQMILFYLSKRSLASYPKVIWVSLLPAHEIAQQWISLAEMNGVLT